MAVSPAQLASYTADHEHTIPYDTSPRHLAGPGDPRHVTHALLSAGWRVTSADGDPRIPLTAPTGEHQLRLDPFGSRYWRIDTDDGPWQASFSQTVPAEIIAGLTDRLTGRQQPAGPGAWQRMVEAGWRVDRDPDGTAPPFPLTAARSGPSAPGSERIPNCRSGGSKSRPRTAARRSGTSGSARPRSTSSTVWPSSSSPPPPSYAADGNPLTPPPGKRRAACPPRTWSRPTSPGSTPSARRPRRRAEPHA
ncbi:hypothetical protein SLA_7136 [Streptomyces laurentii]|uniref:DUF317 domain-containing protein n=1 Tax=Streptomyces laurentii TaxID=39478 RepID=A0A169PIS8_STRLU|nr:hypothetical protein SLA_7136 [Streptomyces laurentii]